VSSKKENKAEGLLQQKSIQSGNKHAKTTFECLRLRLNRAQPYVEQITRQIAFLLASGIFQPGDSMPSVEDAKEQFGVSKNTTFAVYRLLSEYGMSSGTTGGGTLFTLDAEHKACRYLFSERIAAIVQYGQTLDLGNDEMVAAVLSALSRLEEQSAARTGNIPIDDAP
jgi:DNA-binding transcriptional regulator YhcF (GntR family)